MTAVSVRERPPLRLAATVELDNQFWRWAGDERHPENVPSGVQFSDTMPGGFEHASCVLPRDPAREYRDFGELATLRWEGLGGSVAWEGRIETSPRTSGDRMAITPGAVGWQAHLDDDTSARAIYVDRDLSKWVAASVQQKVNDLNAGIDVNDPSVGADQATGQPALVTSFTAPLGRGRTAKANYDARGLPIGRLYAAWKASAFTGYGPNWSWRSFLMKDDVQGGLVGSGNLLAAGPGTATLDGSADTYDFAGVELYYSADTTAAQDFTIFWTVLAVSGKNGVPLQGTDSFTEAKGVFASDVVIHAVSTFAPLLRLDRAGESTITPSSFIIPQLVFTDPTVSSEIIKGASRFDLEDWAVWEDRTFYWGPRNGLPTSRRWRARVGPTGLEETGPTIERVFNGVIVTYQDVTAVARSVGPPGSGVDAEDALLLDSDPLNPANVAGVHRYARVTMQTTTQSAAIQVGSRFLQEQKVLQTSGQATLHGYVEDADSGAIWPAWKVRSGDLVMFSDAADTGWRRIVKKTWDDSAKTAQIQLDTPPEGLQELLERMSISLTGWGVT